MEKGIQLIFDGILEGDSDVVSENVSTLLEAGVEPKKILDEGLIAAMEKVGQLFESGDFFVPEMLIAARAMKAGLELLKPRLMEAEVESKGKVVIGTVKGDLHDIGKNLVAVMLEGAGFDIVDLGVDIDADQFVEAVKAGGVDVLAMSALLTTTMPGMEATIAALETAGLRDDVKVIIGGAPVTQKFADEIGADGFASDAGLAVTVTKSLLQ